MFFGLESIKIFVFFGPVLWNSLLLLKTVSLSTPFYEFLLIRLPTDMNMFLPIILIQSFKYVRKKSDATKAYRTDK